MKKVLFVIFSIIVICVSYLMHREYSYSPLSKSDFQKLFKGYIESPNKVCSKNFLDLSSHGEFFEIYLYNTKDALIDKDFPKITEWEHNKITNEATVGNWKKCPLDSQAMALYKFTLTSNNLDNVKCSNSFNKEILNPDNYYSYIYFSELEQYFLIYCKDRQELYYIRRKGF